MKVPPLPGRLAPLLPAARVPAARLRRGWRPGLPQWTMLEWAFLAIGVLALSMRLFELAGRTVHYDEAIHLHYAFKLATGEGFEHSPWMHGPFQIELLALVFRLLGDSTFIGRLPFALFGVALTLLPYLFRDALGRYGAAAAALLLALSPVLLYFSRFGRNDIIMAVGAALLLLCAWRWQDRGQERYLYIAAAAAAVMLASKETAYFILFLFGASAAALGWRDLWGAARSPRRWADVRGRRGSSSFWEH